MVFMGSKDMLCRVAILNIGRVDTLAPFTMKESAPGFKKSLAFQPHGIKQSRGMSGEGIWTTKRQPGSPCTSPDVMLFMGPSKDMLCKVAMLNIARTPHRGGWLQEEAGFSAARNQAEQRLVRRGHLDHHKGWRTRSHTSVKEFAAGFMKTLAFQLRAIKQNKGSSGLRSNVADSAVLT